MPQRVIDEAIDEWLSSNIDYFFTWEGFCPPTADLEGAYEACVRRAFVRLSFFWEAFPEGLSVSPFQAAASIT